MSPCSIISFIGVSAASSKINFVDLNDFSIHAQSGDQTISFTSVSSGCFFGYHHEELQYWTGLMIPDASIMAPEGGATGIL